MADKNQSNDIAEMLKMLRQTFEADKPKIEDDGADEAKESSEDKAYKDFLSEFSESNEEPEENDEDPWYDGEPEDEAEDTEEESEEELNEEFDEEPEDEPEESEEADVIEDVDDADIVIASADEREAEEDDEDPWFANKSIEKTVEEEIEEIEEPEEESIEEEIEEIEEPVEEPTEEEIEEIEEPEEEPIEEEIEEIEDPVEESIEEEIEEIEETVEEPTEEEIEEIEEPEEESIEEEIEEIEDPEEEPIEEIEEPVEEPIEEEIDVFAYPEEDDIDDFSDIDELDETKEDGLDETDISLLQNMGFTSFSGIDCPTVQEDSAKPENSPEGDVAYDFAGEEYVIKKQSDEIKMDYARQKKHTLIRLAIAGGASLLLLIYEALAFAGVALPGLFNQEQFPLSHAMISLQLLVIAAAMSLNLIVKGVTDTFKLRSTPYSVGSMLIFVNVVYTVAIAIFSPEKYMLFNFAGAFAAILSIVYEYILLLEEERAFSVVSCEGADKYVLIEDREEARAFGEAPTLRAYNTDFNKGFFANMKKRSSEYRYLGILILSVIGCACLAFALIWIMTGNLTIALNGGMLLVNFSLPLGIVGAYSIPLMLAVASLKKDNSTIVGHGSADRYNGTRFVTFDETDIFPSIKTTYVDLKPAGNQQISYVLNKTSALFSEIGGPLSRLVEKTDENGGACKVDITSIFDDGISAVVDGSPMLVGSARFLEINKIDVNAPTDYRDSDGSNEILYVAIDGKLAARYYIKYVPDPDFVSAVNRLGDAGVSVGIRTRNPGVNSQIIERRCPEMKHKVYTIKAYSCVEQDGTAQPKTSESGIVAHKKAASLATPLIMSISLKKYYKFDMYIRFASAAIGSVIVLLFAAMGRVSELGSFITVLYQLAWFVPSLIIGWFISQKKNK